MLKVVKSLETALCAIAALALIAMIILSVTNALGRTWFSSPIHGANEISAQWLLPITVLLALPSTQVWKENYVVSIVTERLNPTSLGLLKAVGYGASAILCAAIAWFGLEEALSQMEIRATAGVTSLPVWQFYFLVPIGFALAMIVFVFDAVLSFRDPHEDINTGTGKSINHDAEEETV
ncbi:TRAP transporter small permease [Brevibacterium sp. GP-SGM9]|uniref:TRAP transporter small permease n=1 Tax=unclassified Brevibacterium TaxID=2614124 RepID=UPI001E2BD684|nr:MULTISPECIES: TRAP transporter small permease [unclassified Brevibacterium]MCD1286079.1 hypothetical protein [Brevibacterium sp. CCUG 69071]MDK8433431.1 TRAP transporter small permease [Brevibacterium sp. H-BE7]